MNTHTFFLALGVLTTLSAVSPLRAATETGARGLVRINSTIQTYSPAQPWERTTPRRRRGLGAVLPDQRILTTAEMIANGTYIELESADGTRTAPARLLAIDYEANLALITPEDEGNSKWLKDIEPLETNGPIKIGDQVNVWQLEENGSAMRTIGSVRSVDLLSTFVPGNFFLSYEVKASMQSASSSYTLPVTLGGKLLGILTSYNSKDQISDVIAPEIVSLFLADVADGEYTGFPSLGVATVLTEDPQFRKFLGLTDEHGGLYISRVLPGSAADQAGLEKEDVILSIDGNVIDRRGYYEDPQYGRLFWSNLIRGKKKVGETISISLLRKGEVLKIDATLRRAVDRLIPNHIHDQPPSYLIKGGLVFQELSEAYLAAFGKDWESRAPLNLLDALRNPKDYEEGRKRLVFLSRVVATPATVGYEGVSNLIVSEVNGHPIKEISSLAEAFKHPKDGLHTIRIDDVPYVLYLEADVADFVDSKLLESGLPELQRLR